MATFGVVVVTAAPPGQAAEAGGAFVKVDGREALLRSVELFLNRDNIKQIQLLVQPEALEEAKRKHGPHFGFSGVKLVGAGPRWVDQLVAASKLLAPDITHVLVHDAARPVVPYTDINALMEAAETHDVAALASAVRTPLAEVDEGGAVVAIHRASSFMHLLTPISYSRAKFEEMGLTGQEPHASQMSIVKGSPLNIRVGGAGDAGIAKAMLAMAPKPKSKAPAGPFDEAQW